MRLGLYLNCRCAFILWPGAYISTGWNSKGKSLLVRVLEALPWRRVLNSSRDVDLWSVLRSTQSHRFILRADWPLGRRWVPPKVGTFFELPTPFFHFCEIWCSVLCVVMVLMSQQPFSCTKCSGLENVLPSQICCKTDSARCYCDWVVTMRQSSRLDLLLT